MIPNGDLCLCLYTPKVRSISFIIYMRVYIRSFLALFFEKIVLSFLLGSVIFFNMSRLLFDCGVLLFTGLDRFQRASELVIFYRFLVFDFFYNFPSDRNYFY